METIKAHYTLLLANNKLNNIKDIMLINYQRDNTFKKPNSDLKRNWDLVQRNSYSVLSAK